MLCFAKNPSHKTLRPLVELHGRDRDRMRAEVEILARQLRQRLESFAQPADALVRKAVLKKREFASPYLEFLDMLEKAARKMPQPHGFDPGSADGIRHTDLDAWARVLNEMIYPCQRSLEAIGHARLDLDARSWARGMGLKE